LAGEFKETGGQAAGRFKETGGQAAGRFKETGSQAAGESPSAEGFRESREERGSRGSSHRKPALKVVANGKEVTLTGKSSYIFVDVFDAIGFDINAIKGRSVYMRLNGEEPTYTAPLHQGDTIEIRWED